jgi:hypothetical protein
VKVTVLSDFKFLINSIPSRFPVRGFGSSYTRIDELAEKCNEGKLSEAEKDEYESYADAIRLIGNLQRRAKLVLANGAHR